MQQPQTPLERIDQWSRTDWADGLANFLYFQFQEKRVLPMVIAGGLEAFIQMAQPIVKNHHFQREDFERMFVSITTRARHEFAQRGGPVFRG